MIHMSFKGGASLIQRAIVYVLILVVIPSQIFLHVLMPRWYGKENVVVNGFVDPRFKELINVFRDNFIEGLERDGAHLSVYYEEKLVADIWAGYSNTNRGQLWTRSTKNVLFSISKTLSSLCVALLVDRGILHWDDYVADYWREYAQNGKENTTVEHILSHQSGLPYIEEPIEYSDMFNKSSLFAKLAAAKPIWEPGTASGYHTLTHGWLIDGLMRSADHKGRSLEEFFAEEIAEPNGLDISIGLKHPNDHAKIAFLTLPDGYEIARDILQDPRMVAMYALFELQPKSWAYNRMMNNPSWMRLDYEVNSLNDPEIQALPLGSIMGISSSRELARLFSLMLEGKLFIRNSTLEALMKPTVENWHVEQCVLYPMMKGRGFVYEYHPYKRNKYIFGHPGYGCQTLHLDLENRLSVVYLSNGLKTSTSALCRPYNKLLNQIYRGIYNN